MNEQVWYTLKQIEAITGRPEKTLRRHHVQEWKLDGMAKKQNGKWLCNGDAVTDIKEILHMREKRENDRLMAEDRKARENASKVAQTDSTKKIADGFGKVSGFTFNMVNVESEMVDKFLEGVNKGRKPVVDELGRQTIHVDPAAKSVRIVLPAGCTTSLLFDIQQQNVEPKDASKPDPADYDA